MEISRLAAIPLFGDLSEGDLAAVAGIAADLEVPSGKPVATEGDFGHALFAVESGTANVVIGGTTVRTVGPGDLVGEVAVLSSGRRTASVIATSPMRLIALFKRDVWALDRRAPLVAQRLLTALDEHRALDEERARQV
jgi:CRP-like cAMP-binding protein